MEISKKIDYALRLLSEVAQAQEGEVVSERHAAEKHQVPYSFARTIQHELVKAGLLETMRGPLGGMKLAIDPHEVTLLEVIEMLQGPLRVAASDDEQGHSMRFGQIWSEAEAMLCSYFSAVTLYEVVVEGKVPVLKGGCSFDSAFAAESPHAERAGRPHG